MKGKRVGPKECQNGEAERNVVGAFEKEIMSRAGVEFCQDKKERERPIEDVNGTLEKWQEATR